MKFRQIILTVAFSFLGGFLAVVILLHGVLPWSNAACPQLEDTGNTPCGSGDANGDGTYRLYPDRYEIGEVYVLPFAADYDHCPFSRMCINLYTAWFLRLDTIKADKGG